MNAKALKDYSRQRGADLIGIASIDRFRDLPPEKSPLSIFPECRSVVVLGRRILRGSIRGVEEGTNFNSTYATFGFRWLEDTFLSRTSYDVTCWMETQGVDGVPLFGYAEEGMPKGTPVAPGKPAPNVILDVDYAAQAAGLGEVGLGGFFITPQYGPRQRFCLILTDAELEADPVSDKTVCGDCGACISACPLGAMSSDNKMRIGVPGHEMTVASIDYAVCRNCPNGAMVGPGRGSRPDRCAAACVRACIDRLEKEGKCENKFQNQFRKRAPWALDSHLHPVEEASGKASDIGCGKKMDGGRK